MTDLPDHDPDLSDHDRPIPVITIRRSTRSRRTDTRTAPTGSPVGAPSPRGVRGCDRERPRRGGPRVAARSANWSGRRGGRKLPDAHLPAELGVRPRPPLVLQAGQVGRRRGLPSPAPSAGSRPTGANALQSKRLQARTGSARNRSECPPVRIDNEPLRCVLEVPLNSRR